MTPEQRAAHIRKLVDSWPPLTPAQRDRLAMIFRASQQGKPVPDLTHLESLARGIQ